MQLHRTETSPQKCLVVLGMHRSGTSALAGALHQVGVHLGSHLMPPAAGNNPKGFFENTHITYGIHEKLLAACQSSWDDQFPLPEHWWQHAALAELRQEARDLLHTEFRAQTVFGIKDPRMCLLLPFWQPIFKDLAITPHYLLMVRHPLEIAASLAARDGFSVEKSVILWLNALFSAEDATRAQSRRFVAFDDVLTRPRDTLTAIADAFAIHFPVDLAAAESVLRQFLTPELRHHRVAEDAITPPVLSVMTEYYEILHRLASQNDFSARDAAQIDALRAAYWQNRRGFLNADLRTLKERATIFLPQREQMLQQQASQLQQQEQTIQQQASQLQQQEQTIQQQAQALQAREQTIQHQAQALQSKDSEIGQKSLLIHRMENTFSWKITRPLRTLRNLKLFAKPWSYHDASWKGKILRFGAKKLWPQFLIRQSGLFDQDYYLQNNPDVAKAGGNPLQHFLRHGGSKGRNPNPLFDSAYYWERFPDVCQSQMNPLIHYVLYGRFEERWTNPFFDAAYYLKHYPDVQAAGIDPLLHYLVYGGVEGRKPSLEFDSAYYLAANPDVRQSGMNPLVHYLCYGAKEGRFSSLTKTLDPYQRWMVQNEPTPADIEQQRHTTFPYQPTLSLITPVYQTPRPFLEAMLESVRQQTYPHWELCMADGGSAEPYIKEILTAAQADARIKVTFLPENLGITGNSNAAAALATGDWIVLLDHDDTLAPFALFEIVKACNAQPDADFIYSDEDKLDARNDRCDPFFKPDWSPDTLRSYNYTIHCSAYRKTLFDTVGGFRTGFDGSQDYDLNLRITERARQIVHLPAILYHWRIHALSIASNSAVKAYAYPAAQRALRDHLQRIGLQGQVTDGLFPGSYHVMHQLPSPLPTISMIIPTHEQAELLAVCLHSILEKSSYRQFEILLLENGSHDPATFALYEHLQQHVQIRLLAWEHPFNYAAINNWGAAQATGEVLLFLNNDVEVVTADWLERMLEQVLRPEIGAVGAKLYYPDDTIQHGGVIIGLGGVAGHAHKGFPRLHPGYCRRLQIIQNVSAVTGACLMVRKSVFAEIGGFDEGYALAFNDVDLCLKIRANNYLIIWTPYAELYHHESKTRGVEDTPAKQRRFQKEIRRFQQKWPAVLTQGDPYYNPNLTLDREDFSLNLRAPYPHLKHGRCINVSNHKALSRKEKVLRHIHRHGQGIEIGPSYNPIAPKKDGYQVQIIDHLNCEQLRAKYRDQRVNVDNIEEVDFVWQGQSYVELTGYAKYYDWIIAAHVIEHTPDLIGFLLDCDSILKDDGVLSLVIPDKRYCFDHYRPLTGLAHILDSHWQHQQMPTPGALTEQLLYAVANAGHIAWEENHPAHYTCVHTIEQARQAMQAQLKNPAYHDVHVWCFVPHAFRLLIHDLFQLGIIPFQEVDFFPTEAGEFFVALSRQGKGLTSSRVELLEMIETEIAATRE